MGPTAIATASLLAALAASGQPRPTQHRQVPLLKAAPKLDGKLKDLSPAYALPSPPAGPSAQLTGKVSARKDAVYVGVEITDQTVTPGDLVELSFHFPTAGLTATGYTFRFAIDGKRASSPESGTPERAYAEVHGRVEKTPEGFNVEAAIPVRSLPRIPAKGPLTVELCLRYEDRDEVGKEPAVIQTCQGGSMSGGALTLPGSLRTSLGIKPPTAVEGLEARPGGWAGYSALLSPVWVKATGSLTAKTLAGLVTDAPLEAEKLKLPIPDALRLPGGRIVVPVLAGAEPNVGADDCRGEQEIRVALYLLKGQAAERVLDWPVVSCALGRATSFALDDDEGELVIGYTGGNTIHFIWTADHFERTELGLK
jgi:hypothetical protein